MLVKKKTDTSALNSHDKGKGVAGECRGRMFDIIVPNSLGYNDDVIIDEQHSTPTPKSHLANSKPPLARKMHWSTGVPKILHNRYFSHSIQFAVNDVRPRPMKLPKIEPANNDNVPYLAKIPTHRPILSMGGCMNNQVPLITQVGPPTGVSRHPLAFDMGVQVDPGDGPYV
ncbi:uncharacterized protein DS421_16g550210 [Arachis hypogaea]|nr:uncharacterized protein DS421_16g550210 [Arachis hypogaea]